MITPEKRRLHEAHAGTVEHFVYIAGAMDRVGSNDDELWDDQADPHWRDLILL